jgi:Predicted membrane protein
MDKSPDNATKLLAHTALLLAISLALTSLEHMLPPLPFAPPGVRLGLSNIVTMYALFFMGRGRAVILAVLKSLFVFLMRGVTVGILSLAGGLTSLGIMIALALIFRKEISYLLLSIAGAITHNFAQIAAGSLIMETNLLSIYWPVLLISGIILGSVTGTILRVIMPTFGKIFGHMEFHL